MSTGKIAAFLSRPQCVNNWSIGESTTTHTHSIMLKSMVIKENGETKPSIYQQHHPRLQSKGVLEKKLTCLSTVPSIMSSARN